ncbi:GtrA family protein [Bacillus sp. S3]|uniref:GtrA family protein n=1 Tax=Bacillus sp. S3 TaxID=486398 RepID=UPI00118BF813|nr:GtrA family protein [Bacillus sp. S3]QCJ44141.1 GtrA family protein [Bacillus sp. S3]
MKKLMKFGFIGIINTAITIASYAFFVYVLGMNFILANIFAYLLGMFNSYIWNKNWVFQVKESNFLIYVKFITVNLAVLGLNSLGLFILVDTFQFNEFISQVLVVGLSMIVNFILTKTWTFAQKRADIS